MQKEGRGIRSGVWVDGWGLGWVGDGGREFCDVNQELNVLLKEHKGVVQF